MAKITVGQAQNVLAALARAATAGQPNVERTGLGALVQGAQDQAQSTLYSEYQKKLQKEAEKDKGFLGDLGFIGDILSIIPGPQQPFVIGANALAHGAEAVQTGNVLEGLGALAGGVGAVGSFASKAGDAASLAATSSGAMEATQGTINAAANAGSALQSIGKVANVLSPVINAAAAGMPPQMKAAPAAPAGLNPQLAAQAAGQFEQGQLNRAEMAQQNAQFKATQALQQQELGLKREEMMGTQAYQQDALANQAAELEQQRLADEAANLDRDAMRKIEESKLKTPEERQVEMENVKGQTAYYKALSTGAGSRGGGATKPGELTDEDRANQKAIDDFISRREKSIDDMIASSEKTGTPITRNEAAKLVSQSMPDIGSQAYNPSTGQFITSDLFKDPNTGTRRVLQQDIAYPEQATPIQIASDATTIYDTVPYADLLSGKGMPQDPRLNAAVNTLLEKDHEAAIAAWTADPNSVAANPKWQQIIATLGPEATMQASNEYRAKAKATNAVAGPNVPVTPTPSQPTYTTATLGTGVGGQPAAGPAELFSFLGSEILSGLGKFLTYDPDAKQESPTSGYLNLPDQPRTADLLGPPLPTMPPEVGPTVIPNKPRHTKIQLKDLQVPETKTPPFVIKTR